MLVEARDVATRPVTGGGGATTGSRGGATGGVRGGSGGDSENGVRKSAAGGASAGGGSDGYGSGGLPLTSSGNSSSSSSSGQPLSKRGKQRWEQVQLHREEYERENSPEYQQSILIPETDKMVIAEYMGVLNTQGELFFPSPLFLSLPLYSSSYE